MSTKKAKSFNHQVYEKAYQRLILSPSQRSVFQRLLGFLIRNDKPFPYSAVKMADLTGLCLRTIFNILNDLENLRLINRVGLGKNRRFIKGNILKKICATVQNRTKIMLVNNLPTVQLTTQNSPNRAMVAYKKTSSSLKRKESVLIYNHLYQEYHSHMIADIKMGLISECKKILSLEEWLELNPPNT